MVNMAGRQRFLPRVMFTKCFHGSEELYAVSEGHHSLLLLWLEDASMFFKCLVKEMGVLFSSMYPVIPDIKKLYAHFPHTVYFCTSFPTQTIISSFQPLLPYGKQSIRENICPHLGLELVSRQ